MFERRRGQHYRLVNPDFFLISLQPCLVLIWSFCIINTPTMPSEHARVLPLPPHFLHYSYATSAVAVPAKLCNMGRVLLIKELHPESFHTSPDPSCFKPGQIEKLPHVMMRTRVLNANPCVLVRRETYRKRVRGYRNVDHPVVECSQVLLF